MLDDKFLNAGIPKEDQQHTAAWKIRIISNTTLLAMRDSKKAPSGLSLPTGLVKLSTDQSILA